MIDFDLRNFIDNLRATKPPYECPFSNCDRVYKSFSGIQSHLQNFKHNSAALASLNVSTSAETPLSECIQNIPNQQNLKIIEYENALDGKSYKLNVLEPLELTYINVAENALPKRTLREIMQNANDEKTSSPVSSPIAIKEPEFRIIEEFSPCKAVPMPDSYIKYIERPAEELEEEVEYDMDEEDEVWLRLINDIRRKTGLPRVSESNLEKIMDVFEKSCHFTSSGKSECRASIGLAAVLNSYGQPVAFDEDAVCCVCLDGECDNANAILFCDMCNLSVHQECYGVPYIPEGQWLCRRCQLSPSQAVECVLCPNGGGAFKQTSDARWAHVTCAIWVPEVQFANTVFLEPIEGFERIPPARWKLSCYVCKQKRGACIQCHKPSCYTAFHVTCAQLAGLHMKLEPVSDLSPGGTAYGVRKTAFCDVHAPADANLDASSVTDDARVRADRREEARSRIKKARRLLCQRRNSSPIVSLPVVPRAKLDEISAEVKFPGKKEFFERLLCYWTLKRQSRFGVPLLRRLQVCQSRRATPEEQRDLDELKGQVLYWKRVRRDLEKTRLLVELLRKREQRKKELINVSSSMLETCLKPIRQCLASIVDRILEQDEMNVFAKPVSEDDVPGYRNFISTPMDLSTMAQKAKRGDYFDLSDMQKDFTLMINNCLKFNKKNQFFIKYAQKMRKMCSEIWQDGHDEFEQSCQKVAEMILSIKAEEEALSTSNLNVETELNQSFEEYYDKHKRPVSSSSTNRRSKSPSRPKEAGFVAEKKSATALPKTDKTAKRPSIVKKRRSQKGGVSGSDSQSDIRKFFSSADTKLDKSTPQTESKRAIKFEDLPRKAVESPKNRAKKESTTSTPKKVFESPKKKLPDTFGTFRQTDPKSPCNLSDVEKPSYSRAALHNDSSFSMTSRNALAAYPPLATTAAIDNDQSDSDRCEEDGLLAGSSSRLKSTMCADTLVRQVIDVLLEHLDIVWAWTSDHGHYFPGVVIDPQSDDYPTQIPRPPNEFGSAKHSENGYLVHFFNKKPIWRWVEKRLVEPMFVDNDLDRRKLLAPNKRKEQRVLRFAYKHAVEFRCANTGEDASEFSIIDNNFITSDDTAESSN